MATALSEGESKRKHVVLLEVMGEQWRTVKVALRTVRPFLFESVRLHNPLLALLPGVALLTTPCKKPKV